MALPTNFLQDVETYQASNLAYLLNHFAFINKANKKFKNFDKIEANLGDTVTFDLPPRYTTNNSLVATFQDSKQRVHSLTVAAAKNVAAAFSAQQFMFNVRDYMEKFGMSAMKELGTVVESEVARLSVRNTYRYYGDGTTPINSYKQLAEAVALLEEYGSATGVKYGFLDNLSIPAIIDSGTQRFVPKRNEEIANSWELGSFSETEWFRSNLLSIHNAGTVGNTPQTLTVTAFTTDPDGGISDITFSGASVTDVDAIKQYDLLRFDDGVTGHPNLRYRTFIGHEPCGVPVQFSTTADAGSDGGGNVKIFITPKLYSGTGIAETNISHPIAVGMEVSCLPSHRAGLLYSGNALFLAMPSLPEEVPFPTANKMDVDSGASIRMYYGSKFGENERGLVHDVIWGATLVPEYAMRLVFPL